MIILETDRLVLRRFTLKDAAFILELVNEAGFIENIGDKGVGTLKDARHYIRSGPQTSYDDHGYGLYRVELKETGEPIGMCGLLKRDSLEFPDIGFALLERFWGSGYANESASAVLEFGNQELGLERIDAITSPDNHSSIRLLEKIGLQFKEIVALGPSEKDVKLFTQAK